MTPNSAHKCLFAISIVFCMLGIAIGETVVHEGAEYWIYRVDPKKEKLELFLGAGKGQANTVSSLEDRLNKQGRTLKFAINAGIYEPDFMSSGLHISEGKVINPINLKDFVKTREGEFTPNFYLKPNGVFCLLENGKSGIVESKHYQTLKFESPVRLANQSGPLLAYQNRIHPVFSKDSKSALHRNGIGVTKGGIIIFACTVDDPEKGLSNLHNFSTLFTSKLQCPNALYLDGDISYVFIKGVTPPLKKTNLFAGIFGVTEEKP